MALRLRREIADSKRITLSSFDIGQTLPIPLRYRKGLSRFGCHFAEDYLMRPMLVPERDLKGATPEKLALALLRPRRARKPVVGDKAAVQEPSADKPGHRLPHLLDRS